MGTDMWGAFKGMTPQAAPFTPARTAPQGQAAEMEGAQRTMEGLVERMFASAGGRQAELADAARVLEGQAAEVGRSALWFALGCEAASCIGVVGEVRCSALWSALVVRQVGSMLPRRQRWGA